MWGSAIAWSVRMADARAAEDEAAPLGGARPPWLSVLLPCWNAEQTIEGAIRSVLEATSLDLECVVIDDGSTDGTADSVAAIAARDPRVVLIRLPENQGVSAARNRGLDAIRGEWLTFLDADDRFLPGGLETLARAAQTSGASAVIGQQVWTDGVKRWVGSLYDIPDIRDPGRKSLGTHPGLLYYVSPHAKLFPRPSVADLRFSGRVLGDQAWVIGALLRAGDGIEVLGATVYEWHRAPGAGSITATARSSARRGVEAAQVAGEALAAVTREANARLDPAGREVVLTRYVESILRSDLGAHLGNALARRDPTISELLDAIRAFAMTVPGRYLSGSDALARDILDPGMRRWRLMNRAGRAAYWRLFDTARRLDPGIAGRAGTRAARFALRVAAWHPAYVARRAAGWLIRRSKAPRGLDVPAPQSGDQQA